MRIVLIGQQAFAQNVLTGLLDKGYEVVGVFTDIRDEDATDVLADTAKEKNIPVYRPWSFKKPEVAEQMAELKPDLCVMAFVWKIVPNEIIDLPPLGTIQFHPSLLPRHRGPASINWAMLMGDDRTGITIFWPDGGLDTGPILMERSCAITPDDTVGTLYFNKLFPIGVEAMIESVGLVERDIAPKIPQDPGSDTYEPWCKPEHVKIDWSKSATEVYNMCRSADPAPGANAEIDGKMVQFFDTKPLTDKKGSPGEILDNSEGLIVACGDGAIQAGRVRVDGGKKGKPADIGEDGTLKVGAKLS